MSDGFYFAFAIWMITIIIQLSCIRVDVKKIRKLLNGEKVDDD